MTLRIACSVLIASLALLVSCGPPDRQSSEALIGHWLGNASYRDATVKFEFDIVQSGDSLVAFFTSDEMLERDRPIGRVWYDKPRVHFVIPAEYAPMTFDGWLRRNLIVGSLTSVAFPDSQRKATLPQLSLRHTHPSMFPYRVDTLESRARVYTPSLQGPYPAVLLVPDLRQPLGVSLDAFADRFARAGFVALVLGTADDPAQAFQALHARRDVDGERVGVWGFGRGATQAVSLATTGRATFVVAVSPQLEKAGGDSAWRILDTPLLAFRGTYDGHPARSAFAKALKRRLSERVSRDQRLVTVAQTDQSLRKHASQEGPFDWPREAPGVLDSMITWMLARSFER